jgi:hypothetical protein
MFIRQDTHRRELSDHFWNASQDVSTTDLFVWLKGA